MADQAMYHQGNQSVFVGGRPWTLLPPPAEINYGELIHENHEKIEVLHLFRCVTHTHPANAGFLFWKNQSVPDYGT